MTLRSFEGKTALITGGGSGIGFGLAQALIERGAAVAIIGTDRSRLDAAVARLTAGGGRAAGFQLDVTDRAAWPETVTSIEQHLGPIDFLVLNAGAQGGRRPIEAVAAEEWDWVWSVNVDGVYNGLRSCLPAMRARGRDSHVLITASIAALIPRATVSAYGASKAAALAIAEAVRLELMESPVGVSVFCPGLVRTPIAETMRRHAPNADDQTFAFMTANTEPGLDPLDVGRSTLDAVLEGHFYIFSHPHLSAKVRQHLEQVLAALP